MSIAVIAGLGNPGRAYDGTRHNIGAELVERLGARHSCAWKDEKAFRAQVAKLTLGGRSCWLVKPLTYMNASGESLGPFLAYYRLAATALVAVYDDITLAPGRLKITLTGSDGGHNGIKSLRRHLGEGFVRYRIGIGPKAVREMDLKDHVLGRFSEAERAAIEANAPALLDGLELLLREGAATAMNRLNPHFKSNTPASE